MGLPLPLPAPAIEAGEREYQVKELPITDELRIIFVSEAVQIVSGEGLALACGRGLTVTR
jgi:hypothetical protein